MSRTTYFVRAALWATAVLAMVAGAASAASDPETAGAAAGSRHEGRYWYVVDNIATQPGQPASVTLWAALPLERPGQHVSIGEIVPPPADIIEDPVAGNRVVLWVVNNPLPGASLVFHYDFTVENTPVVFHIDPQKVQRAAADSPEARRFTVSEPWVEITPEIAKKAREIVGAETNPYRQGRLVFDWVVENLTYDYPDVLSRGVVKCFPRLRGDCGEFSHIYIAMMRSLGVPARGVAANWFQGGGHMWAEIFLPPYGWVPVDTSVAQLVKNGSKGQESPEQVKNFMVSRGFAGSDWAFLYGNLYPNRLEVFAGENIAIVSKKTGVSQTFNFMQPGGSNAWPFGIKLTGFAAKTVDAGFLVFGEKRADLATASELAEEHLAASYLEIGMLDKAMRGLENAVQKTPDDSQKLFLLGQAYFGLKRYQDAIPMMQRSIAGKGGSLKPTTDTWAHIFTGMCYDALHKPDLAVAEYDKALAVGADYGGSQAMAKKFRAEHYHPDDDAPKK